MKKIKMKTIILVINPNARMLVRRLKDIQMQVHLLHKQNGPNGTYCGLHQQLAHHGEHAGQAHGRTHCREEADRERLPHGLADSR